MKYESLLPVTFLIHVTQAIEKGIFCKEILPVM